MHDTDLILSRDPFWYCEACGAQNSRLDGECQYCEPEECKGHPAGPLDPMGETVYCDGSCCRNS